MGGDHQPSPEIRTFRYRANPVTMILSGGFFALCAAFMFYKAATNDRGAIIEGLITLGPAGASLFFAGLGVLSSLFVAVAALAMIIGAINKPVLVLAHDHVVIPQRLSRGGRRVDYYNITEASVQTVGRQRFLTLRSAQGKDSIARSLLDSDEDFQLIVETITARRRSR